MRLKLGQPAELERARDCFLLAAKIMDVRCDIVKAGRLWQRDPGAAKAFLKEAMEKSVEIAAAFPEKSAAARSVRDEAKAVAARIPPVAKGKLPVGRDVEITSGIERAIGSLEEVYRASKARCGVP